MGPEFNIATERPEGKPNVVVFHLAGWLDMRSEARFVEAVQQEVDAGAEYVLVDMAGLEAMTSAGIRAMQKAYYILTPKVEDPEEAGMGVRQKAYRLLSSKQEAHKVVRLRLCNARPQVTEVLGITGLLKNVPMSDSVDKALEQFEM